MKINKIILFSCFVFLVTTTYASQKITTLGPYQEKQIWNYYKIINNTNKKIMVPYTDSNSNILWNYVNSNFLGGGFSYWQSLNKIYHLWWFTIRNLQCRNVTVRSLQQYQTYYVKKWFIKFNTLPGHWNWTWTQVLYNKCIARRQYKTRYTPRCQSFGYPATDFIPWASRRAYGTECTGYIMLHRYSYDCSLASKRESRRVNTIKRVCN